MFLCYLILLLFYYYISSLLYYSVSFCFCLSSLVLIRVFLSYLSLYLLVCLCYLLCTVIIALSDHSFCVVFCFYVFNSSFYCYVSNLRLFVSLLISGMVFILVLFLFSPNMRQPAPANCGAGSPNKCSGPPRRYFRPNRRVHIAIAEFRHQCILVYTCVVRRQQRAARLSRTSRPVARSSPGDFERHCDRHFGNRAGDSEKRQCFRSTDLAPFESHMKSSSFRAAPPFEGAAKLPHERSTHHRHRVHPSPPAESPGVRRRRPEHTPGPIPIRRKRRF